MSEQPDIVPPGVAPPAEPGPVVVSPESGSKLEQLHALYQTLKERSEVASKELKAVTDALKVEMTNAAPEGSTRVVLEGSDGPRLALAYSERQTVDSRRLRREQPAIYGAYLTTSGSWSLRVAKDGDE